MGNEIDTTMPRPKKTTSDVPRVQLLGFDETVHKYMRSQAVLRDLENPEIYAIAAVYWMKSQGIELPEGFTVPKYEENTNLKTQHS